MAVQWRGVFPAATTQFHQDQAIDISPRWLTWTR